MDVKFDICNLLGERKYLFSLLKHTELENYVNFQKLTVKLCQFFNLNSKFIWECGSFFFFRKLPMIRKNIEIVAEFSNKAPVRTGFEC